MEHHNDASKTPVVDLHGLTKKFGNRSALRKIDLRVETGERLVIFGPNGAGKTTLIKIIATLMKPTSGTITINGYDISKKPNEIRQRIALVSHHTYLYNDLTVSENMQFYAKMYNIEDRENRIDEMINWAKLQQRKDDKAGTLSRGMQQRASIARAMLHRPDLLLLDEPETGLDADAGSMIIDLAEDRERTIITATHNLVSGLEMADRIMILNRGTITFQTGKQEIDVSDFRTVYDEHTGAER